MSLIDHYGADWQKVKFQSHGLYSVFGVFDTQENLDAAVEKLRDNGFSREDLSIIIPEKLQSTLNHHNHLPHNGKEGAAAGVATGAVLGGTLGWLIGIGAFSITGVGPFLAAGPILAAITGMGIGGTVGGISGALIGYGIPELEAKKIEDKIHGGGILLSIHCNDSDWMNRAQKLLEVSGAQEIASTFES